MRILFIDLASHNGLLACVTEHHVVASVPLDHRVDDGELMTMLEKVLQEAGWKFADLTHVACVTGPGGFMSLRVAVALANTLVHQLKIPGTGVHLSDVYAARISPHPPLDSARGTLSRGTG
ncbi:MAG: tRNA (adenosine(37)-N6)-threonylcarbamoyltransferase complex dimerization subunit type 1 TsaB [Candidatus Peribacteraceae bacterium]|nr:tRNA (adenosine(37)-N6)-threonylcarbamoyltransferase complex dimerization subunit type 1 TsaB [Candidatus Peribacteraceae bacterium]